MYNTERKEILKNEFKKESKTLKKDTLRYNEYYNMQSVFDTLYKQSQQGSKFKNLFNLICNENNILLAYRTIKRNKGSKTPGTNRHNIKHLETSNTRQLVEYIQSRLYNYQPQKVRRVDIPKPNGKTRPLSIPCIEDRIIQQCIKQILEPICEAKFHPHSYGFRPNRGTEHAISYLIRKINQDNMYYVVDIDIKGFFDNVNHSKLLKQLWTMGIQDKKLLCIISVMLKAEIEGIGIPTKGVPQGGILSPLLANVVLNELDWWISSQWETYSTSYNYGQNSHKYRAMRKSNLKEMFIVRYADDFKVICRSKDHAKKIFIATQGWLKERLDLDISPDKSKITNMRKNTSEFLGFQVRAVPKKTNVIAYSSMTDKAKKTAENTIRTQLKYIQKNPTNEAIYIYNRLIAGLQNYYQIASNVYLDFREIEYNLLQCLKNRLKTIQSKNGIKSNEFISRYEHYGGKMYHVANTALYPIKGIHSRIPKGFNQNTCNFTERGRQFIHDKLGYIDKDMLKYLSDNPVPNESVEYNDNRLSLYSAQKGMCPISYLSLKEDMIIHRKISNGEDTYSNLVLVTPEVHKCIHETNDSKIRFYFNLLHLTDKAIRKLNQYRKLIGNEIIKIDK